jgi:hypothetical protein
MVDVASRLNPGDLIAAEKNVQDSAAIHEVPALSYRQLVIGAGDKAMVYVVTGAAFGEVAV